MTSILFYLFCRSNSEKGTPLLLNDVELLKSSEFSPSRKTKFITHGWKSSASSTGQVDMKNGKLRTNSPNIKIHLREGLRESCDRKSIFSSF